MADPNAAAREPAIAPIMKRWRADAPYAPANACWSQLFMSGAIPRRRWSTTRELSRASLLFYKRAVRQLLAGASYQRHLARSWRRSV